MSKFEKALKKRKAKRDGGYTREQYFLGSIGDVAKQQLEINPKDRWEIESMKNIDEDANALSLWLQVPTKTEAEIERDEDRAEQERQGIIDSNQQSVLFSFPGVTSLRDALEIRQAKRDGGRIGYGKGGDIIKQLISSKPLQDKDYAAVVDWLGGLDQPALNKDARKWANEKAKNYPTFDQDYLANSYVHAISTYEVSTDNPKGGKSDKGFQKLWRSKARQLGMQAKEWRQTGEAITGTEKSKAKFIEAQKDRRNNMLGINAYRRYGQNKPEAYAYIDRKITERLDSIVSGEGGRSAFGPVINPHEEMYLSEWLK